MVWDESQEFPIPVFKEMGKLGLMGVLVPEEYGGAGLTYFEYKTVIEEISRVCGSIGLSLAAHNSLCTGHIMSFANEEQKKKYLPKLAMADMVIPKISLSKNITAMQNCARLAKEHRKYRRSLLHGKYSASRPRGMPRF